MKSSIAAFLTMLSFSFALEIPANLKTCRKSDPHYAKCLSTNIPPFIESLAPGSSFFKIPSIEPLIIDSVKIGGNSGAVSLKQDYRDVKLYGLTKGLKLTNYKMDFENMIIHSESMNPQVDFVAKYHLDGNVLFLPIRGSGNSNISMINLHSKNDIYCETYLKDGQTYLRVKEYKITFHPEDVKMSFENLFDGDKTLGPQMNAFINENSQLLFRDLQGPYEETFGAVFAKICNQIFSRFPMNKLFPE